MLTILIKTVKCKISSAAAAATAAAVAPRARSTGHPLNRLHAIHGYTAVHVKNQWPCAQRCRERIRAAACAQC